MRVLFLANNCTGVMYWRMFQFFKKMKEKGVDAFLFGFDWEQDLVGVWEQQFETNIKLRDEIYNLLNYCDIGVFQYIHSPLIFTLVMMYQEHFGKQLLAEIDDEVIDTPEYNPAFKQGWKPGNFWEKVIIEHMKVCNGIITSTDYLKKYYQKFNKKIHTIPNCIDFDLWKPQGKLRNLKNLRIGWIGAGNHDEDLKIMEEVVPRILKEYKNVEFYFAHGVPQYIKEMGSRVKWTLGWKRIDKYPQFAASFGLDIGLAPLQINKFNMSKSNLRWLEYSALKVPTVATNIEPYKKSIKHGQTGFLCNNADSWVENISKLIESESLRKEIAENAHQDIRENYNLDIITDKYINVLRSYYNEQRRNQRRNQKVS